MTEAMLGEAMLGGLLAQAGAGGAAGTMGGYISVAKVVGMLIFLFPWLWLAPKVSKDALKTKSSQPLWAGVVLGAGAIGMLCWLFLPYYFLGMLIYVILLAAVFLGYVAYRNGRVEEDDRILTSKHLSTLFEKKEKVDVKPVTKVRLYNADGKLVPPPTVGATERDILIYNFAQDFFFDMLWRRASEADIVPSGAGASVRFVIDGTLTPRPSMSVTDSDALVQYIKTAARMNIEERRRPQQGVVSLDIPGDTSTKIVVTSAGTTGGQRMQLRIQKQIVQTRLAELGMSKDVYTRAKAATKEKGIVLVSGRSGTGVTSTLYSLLREHDSFTQQLVTFEKKPVTELENVTQTRYQEASELAPALVSTLRRDFDVMMIDECGDAQAASTIAQAGERVSILLGISASDTFIALAKWIKLVGGSESALANLRGILCQMLVRKLCLNCREPYKPDPSMLAKANIAGREVDVFYRTPTKPKLDEKGIPILCQNCQGIGYFGRTAAFEWLEMTDDIKKLVLDGANASQIKAACRKKSMLYLQEQALAKVISGETSIQEVIRVSQQEKPAAAK
ncbi:MAG: Flp pilus assembly complex ATPase component TadA [Phycisphaerae bacterium]|nr:Flp pilus assembly complex ATPase component TadA [Phycisphaerae bacterium]